MEDASSYRSISILPVFSKIFEGLLKEKIIKYFQSKELWNAHQHGYMEITTLVEVINYITEVIDGKECTGFEKNYDSNMVIF